MKAIGVLVIVALLGGVMCRKGHENCEETNHRSRSGQRSYGSSYGSSSGSNRGSFRLSGRSRNSNRRNSGRSASAGRLEYLGCHHPASLQMITYNWDHSQMTHQLCWNACAQRNIPYAGLQRGSSCSCGHVFDQVPVIPASVCDVPCAGNNLQICGGNRDMSIYRLYP